MRFAQTLNFRILLKKINVEEIHRWTIVLTPWWICSQICWKSMEFLTKHNAMMSFSLIFKWIYREENISHVFQINTYVWMRIERRRLLLLLFIHTSNKSMLFQFLFKREKQTNTRQLFDMNMVNYLAMKTFLSNGMIIDHGTISILGTDYLAIIH